MWYRTRQRGAALIITLLILTVLAFLGGVLLLMSQGEVRISANSRQGSAAFGAAEAGLETIFNQLPMLTAVECTAFTAGCNGMRFHSGAGRTLGQTTAQPVAPPLGPGQTPPGYNLVSSDWTRYLVYSTGVSTTFLVFVNQVVELQTEANVGSGSCRHTLYEC
jgi:Tfp pilus assembly protein PilX